MFAEPTEPSEEDVRLKGTVLVVDDEDDVLMTLSRLLGRRFPSVHVMTASDGPHALRLVELVNPDLVIADYVMPGMSGLALLGLIHERRPAAFRVLLSGFGSSGAYSHALRAGSVDVLLQKPAEMRNVARVVRTGIAVAAQRRALAPA